jgi:curved DNA-binding protein CbpA
MDFNKDYYAILYILPTADLAIVKAAYKAMLKVYHPDKYGGSQDEAHQKTIEINESYSVLSNIDERNKYDEYRRQNNSEGNEYSYKEESELDKESSSAFNDLEQDWQTTIKYVPELLKIVENLTKTSSKLAFTYKAVMLESKLFSKKEAIAQKMEADFLSLYFGSNNIIQQFGQSLIHDKHKSAARELNKAIVALGQDIDAEQIIDQIENEFKIYRASPVSWGSPDSQEEFDNRSAKELIKSGEFERLKYRIKAKEDAVKELSDNEYTRLVIDTENTVEFKNSALDCLIQYAIIECNNEMVDYLRSL